MTNNNHQCQKRVFSPQARLTSYPAIEQLLPTSGLVPAAQRTNGHHPARQTRISADISRSAARLTADRVGEWSHRPARTDPRATSNIRYRPETAPTHIRLSESNGQHPSHQRQVVTLVQFDSLCKPVSRPPVTRPGTGSNTKSSGHPSTGAPIDPDNSQNAFMPQQRPPGGVRQDKDRFSSDREA
jgi:hypothetical protein